MPANQRQAGVSGMPWRLSISPVPDEARLRFFAFTLPVQPGIGSVVEEASRWRLARAVLLLNALHRAQALNQPAET
jgi:hypothetical protein